MVRSEHTAFQTLPVVDVAGLYSHELSERDGVARELGRACREVGFFYLSGHRVSAELTAGLLQQARVFFALPSAQKQELYIGKSRNHRGYVPPGEEVFYGGAKDQKESFDLCFELPNDARQHPFGGPTCGPACPASVKR